MDQRRSGKSTVYESIPLPQHSNHCRKRDRIRAKNLWKRVTLQFFYDHRFIPQVSEVSYQSLAMEFNVSTKEIRTRMNNLRVRLSNLLQKLNSLRDWVNDDLLDRLIGVEPDPSHATSDQSHGRIHGRGRIRLGRDDYILEEIHAREVIGVGYVEPEYYRIGQAPVARRRLEEQREWLQQYLCKKYGELAPTLKGYERPPYNPEICGESISGYDLGNNDAFLLSTETMALPPHFLGDHANAIGGKRSFNRFSDSQAPADYPGTHHFLNKRPYVNNSSVAMNLANSSVVPATGYMPVLGGHMSLPEVTSFIAPRALPHNANLYNNYLAPIHTGMSEPSALFNQALPDTANGAQHFDYMRPSNSQGRLPQISSYTQGQPKYNLDNLPALTSIISSRPHNTQADKITVPFSGSTNLRGSKGDNVPADYAAPASINSSGQNYLDRTDVSLSHKSDTAVTASATIPAAASGSDSIAAGVGSQESGYFHYPTESIINSDVFEATTAATSSDAWKNDASDGDPADSEHSQSPEKQSVSPIASPEANETTIASNSP